MNLKKLGKLLHERLGVDVYGLDSTTIATDYAQTAKITASEERTGGNYSAANVAKRDSLSYWATNDDTRSASIEMEWETTQKIRYVVLQEPIRLGQRVKDFKIEYSTDGETWKELASNITTTIGYKRIIPLNGSTTTYSSTGYRAKKLRITITDSRACPLISNIYVY